MDNFEINTQLKRKVDVIVDYVTDKIRRSNFKMYKKCVVKNYTNAHYLELRFIYDTSTIVNWVNYLNLRFDFDGEKERITNDFLEEIKTLGEK